MPDPNDCNPTFFRDPSGSGHVPDHGPAERHGWSDEPRTPAPEIAPPAPSSRGPDPDSPDEPFIIRDRICIRCGYTLDGLRSDQACPECSAPITYSLKGDLLRYASPEHVATLHRGITMAQIAALAFPLAVTLGIALEIAADAGVGLSKSAASFLYEGLGVCLASLSLVGWWMFSAPDPIRQKDTAVGSRQLLRISIVIELLLQLTAFGLDFFVSPASLAGLGAGHPVVDFLGGPHGVITIVLWAARIIVWLVRFFASLQYLSSVSVRFPDAKLYARANQFMWLGPVITVLTALLGLPIAYIVYVLMLDRTRKLLRTALQQAREATHH